MRWWSDRAIGGNSAGKPVSGRASSSRSFNPLLALPFLTLGTQPADNAPVFAGMLEPSAGSIFASLAGSTYRSVPGPPAHQPRQGFGRRWSWLTVSIHQVTAQIESIKDLTHDVRQLDLRLVEPATIEFKPGQFISFETAHPETGRLVTRAYSIASPPSRPGVVTLLFNRVSGGPGSTLLYGFKEGDTTRFKGPAGHFTLRDDPGRDLLFVATGTGITPIWSMLLANAERPDPRPATLFWGLRSQRDLYYQEDLRSLAQKMPNLTTVLTLSRPDPGWSGATGRVQQLVEERVTSVAHLAVYLCGSGGMIADVTKTLQQKGLCPIYREKYYDAAAGAKESAAAQ